MLVKELCFFEISFLFSSPEHKQKTEHKSNALNLKFLAKVFMTQFGQPINLKV